MSSTMSIDGIEVSPIRREKSSVFTSAGSSEAVSSGPQPHRSVAYMPHEAPPFRWASLWEDPVVNPINLKSYTLRESVELPSSFSESWSGGIGRSWADLSLPAPALANLNNPYAASFSPPPTALTLSLARSSFVVTIRYTRNFHLAWVGFMGAWKVSVAIRELGSALTISDLKSRVPGPFRFFTSTLGQALTAPPSFLPLPLSPIYH